MRPLLRIGLEFPPLRDTTEAGTPFAVLEAARAAEAAGVGTVWLAEGPAAIDPVPMAGALAQTTTSVGLGIVAHPSRGRHPSVLARDLSTLDLLSGGRAAIALMEDGQGPLDIERLGEAASLLGLLLCEEEVTIAGRFYEVAELTTRPRPAQPDGPVVLAGVTGEGSDAEGAAEAAVVDAGADAFVVAGGPERVAESRRRLDGVAPAGTPPTLVWRGELPASAGAAVRFARVLLDAGADGLMAVWGARTPIDSLLEALGQLAGRA